MIRRKSGETRTEAIKREHSLLKKRFKSKAVSNNPKVKIRTPLGITKDYQRAIIKTLLIAKEEIEIQVVPYLPQLQAEFESMRPKLDSERLDNDFNVAGKVTGIFNSVRLAVAKKASDYAVNAIVEGFANAINTWNKKEVLAAFKSGMGIDLFQGEPYLKEELNVWATQNVNLVKDVSTQFINQSEQLVLDGLRRGVRSEQIGKRILQTTDLDKGRFKTAETRAKIIGRDQVSKLNGTLNRLRQTGAGVQSYIWRTVGDARVRDTHASNNGKEFSWREGWEGLHPGDDYNCRCFAEPLFNTIAGLEDFKF